MAYFRSSDLGQPQSAFVAWVDLMGCRNLMAGPIKIAAQSVYKLHVAALDAKPIEVTLYPIMDGFYATCTEAAPLERFLSDVFKELSNDLIKDKGKVGFQFLIRGAVAHGEIYHGSILPESASRTLHENQDYKKQILIGMPVVDAHSTEDEAPPFGLAIHGTVPEGAFSNRLGTWWRWFNPAESERLNSALVSYFTDARCHLTPKYSSSRITVHEALAYKYFSK